MTDHDHPPRDDRDDVAELLRLAGKRDAVPPEREARARAAARAVWKEQVRARSRRRFLYGAVGVAAAATILVAISLWMMPGGNGISTTSNGAIRVEALNGPAWGRVAGGGTDPMVAELEPGREIHPGTEVETASDGRVSLRLASGHSIRLDRSTTVRLIDGRTLALDAGALYLDSGSITPSERPVEVRTPLGSVREIGTQYEVRLSGDALQLRLREGAAVLQRNEQEHEVRAGVELRLGADGVPTRSPIQLHGAEWAWAEGVAPAPGLEGLTARAFLEWNARERGLRLAFADETVSRAAGEIVLGGSVEGLTPEEALAAVLPTCRMTGGVENGVLVIASDLE